MNDFVTCTNCTRSFAISEDQLDEQLDERIDGKIACPCCMTWFAVGVASPYLEKPAHEESDDTDAIVVIVDGKTTKETLR